MIGVSFAPPKNSGRLELTGDLDARTAPALVGLSLAPRRGRDLVIDLSGVDFVDAAGLGGLITLRARLRGHGGRLRIVGASPRIARTFALGRAEFLLGQQAPGPRAARQRACRREPELTS